jgi:hypothetical protein
MNGHPAFSPAVGRDNVMTSPAPVGSNGLHGPDALATLNQAYDNALADIAGNLAKDARAVKARETNWRRLS